MSTRNCNNKYCHQCWPSGGGRQTHTHEFLGSTMLAEEGCDRHNHRFAGVSGEAIFISGGNHRHEVFSNTDFFDNHHHKFERLTGPGISVGNGKHIHFVKLRTTEDDRHCHEAQFATLIEDPLL